MKRQPRLFDRGKRKAPLIAALVAYSYDLVPAISFDTSDLHLVGPSTCRITRNVAGDHRRPTDVLSPITCVAQGSFDPGRRHLEHIIAGRKPVSIQPAFDRARGSRAIVDADLLTILSLNANVEDRPTFPTADLQLEKLES
ncbi:MAG TPA: hypothetical protein VFP77_00840 [Gemmatimonadaceae bacterium]|nr:hypothetical protein [Gemmatimonadaceae bacterium]